MLNQTDCFEPKTAPVAWSDEEVARLMRMRQVDGMDWPDIAAALGRTESGVRSKLKYHLYQAATRGEPTQPFQREPVPLEVLSEQARRLTAPFRSQASAFCGDPPVGFSALDRRMGV